MLKRSQTLPGVLYPDINEWPDAFEKGVWVASTVGRLVKKLALSEGDRVAFVDDESEITRKALDEKTDIVAAGLLEMGLKRGDRVMFQMGTNIKTVVALLACIKAGLIPVCTLPQYREVEISAIGEKSNAKAMIVASPGRSSFDHVDFAIQMKRQLSSLAYVIASDLDTRVPSLESLSGELSLKEALAVLSKQGPIEPGDVLSFQLSGGSTGIPKIIPRFHCEYIGHSLLWMKRYGIDYRSTIIWPLPIIHNAGQLFSLIPAIAYGIKVVLQEKFEITSMLAAIERHKVTHAMSIGPVAPQLLAYNDLDKHDLSSLQLFTAMNGAARLEAHLGIPCSNLYGITEGLLLGSGPTDPAELRHSTQGSPTNSLELVQVLQPGSEEEVEVGEVGELCFKGPSTIKAFYGDYERSRTSFTSRGLYRTGDLVIERNIDGARSFAFQGRMRDNINRGGEKIGCEEVESYINRHPSILDARLVPMPDPIMGEKGCVFIILKDKEKVVNLTELSGFLQSQGLAKYKTPERIEYVESFPLTKVGKLDKEALKKRIFDLVNQESSGHDEGN